VYIGGTPPVTIDAIDLYLLRILSQDARAPATAISQKIKTSPTVVSYRLKKLESLKVIQNYTVALDVSKIGYSDFRIDLDLVDFKQREDIIKNLLTFPSLTYVFTSIGHSDIQFNLRVKGIDDVHVILNEINTSFPDVIRDYKYIHIPKIHKQNYMPIP
jgi:Lrp/AsnC family leucine-responsive transcriptional regulator